MSVFRSASLAILIVFALLFAGCASGPTAERYLAAGAHDKTYDGFLAYRALKDLVIEGRFEKALCARLRQAGHACVPMLAIAMPTSPQDSTTRQRAMRTSGAQAALVIELIDPTTTSRQLLADGAPAYRVSVIDTKTQAIMARLAIENPRDANDLAARADAVAVATTRALEDAGLLQPR